ncbi:MAG TPA: hypothetical protein VF832_12135 [Longimicrobiales bacterium]
MSTSARQLATAERTFLATSPATVPAQGAIAAGLRTGPAATTWSALRSGGRCAQPVEVGKETQPPRQLQNPVEACPILDRLATAPEEPIRRGARGSAVLLLLLLLL